MIQTAFRRPTLGLIVVLAFSASAFAQSFLLDDLEHGGNRNKLDQYWYTFNYGSILTNHSETFAPTAGGYDGSDYAAAMVFSGLTAPAAQAAYATVGMGTRLSATDGVGFGAGLEGITAVSFWAQGPVGLVFNFQMETIENAQSGPTRVTDNSYTVQRTISSSAWTPYTINVSQLAQEEGWGDPFTFRLANVTKISWTLKSASNTVGSGTFKVDNVQLIGQFDVPDPDDLCAGCVLSGFNIPDPSALLSDFDAPTTIALRNALGQYWYSYSDSDAGGTSTITDEELSEGREGKGVSAGFVMGSPFFSGGYNIPPFAGLGTNLYDEKTTNYLDADNFTGIYFEYMTSTNVGEIKLEVHDSLSAARSDGSDYYVNLPGAGGSWKAAYVPFNKLTANVARSDLDISKLAKIQFVYSGSGSGYISLDNVYFVGSDNFNVIVTPPVTYTLTYTVESAGGTLLVDGETLSTYSVTLSQNTQGPTIKAVPADGKRFVKWSDNNTNAERSDAAVGDITFTAIFEDDTPLTFTVTYIAGDGGRLEWTGMDPSLAPVTNYSFENLAEGEILPVITAHAEEGYTFLRWNDNVTTPARPADVVGGSNALYSAMFIPTNDNDSTVMFTFAYYVGGDDGMGGSLVSSDISTPSFGFTRRVVEGELGPTVTAIADPGYRFVEWDDGYPDSVRTDIAESDLSVGAIFAAIPVAVTEPDRDDRQTAPVSEISVVAPIVVTAGEFSAGPIPASKRTGEIKFFRTGLVADRGTLIIFDATGNVIRKISINDNNANGDTAVRRVVASWNLTDAKGRQVAEGTYLVRGTMTVGGKRERVSMLVSVVK